MKEILIATNNPHKVAEYSAMLEKIGYSVRSLADFGDIEIEENGQTFEENALIKARTLYEMTGIMSIADDSGIEIEALDNGPGVHSARWYHELGDWGKNEKVLELLKDKDNRKAHFICCIAVVDKDTEEVFRGQLDGEIAMEQRGENGFGYDPIFLRPETQKTNGEISMEEKNRISHRAKALSQALAYLREHYEKDC